MDVTWRIYITLGLVATVTKSYEYDPNYLVPPQCTPCKAMACPILTYCAGTVVKDHCGCCERCSSDLFQPHAQPRAIPSSPEEAATETDEVADACDKIACPKFQVCMVNSQGLPICTCPSVNICESGRKKDKKQKDEMVVCGSDGVTYKSRCHMRIANCNSGRRIKRVRKGPCDESTIQSQGSRRQNEVIESDNTEKVDEKRLKAIERANRRRLKKKRKKEKQRRKERERKERKDRKGRKNRRKRMKRRNDVHERNYRYYYLLGRKTNWGRNQIRRNRAS